MTKACGRSLRAGAAVLGALRPLQWNAERLCRGSAPSRSGGSRGNPLCSWAVSNTRPPDRSRLPRPHRQSAPLRQPSNPNPTRAHRSSSIPKWCAISWMTVIATSSTTSLVGVTEIEQRRPCGTIASLRCPAVTRRSWSRARSAPRPHKGRAAHRPRDDDRRRGRRHCRALPSTSAESRSSAAETSSSNRCGCIRTATAGQPPGGGASGGGSAPPVAAGLRPPAVGRPVVAGRPVPGGCGC